MAYTAQTPENIVVGAGNVLVDTVDVGATSGDNGFQINETMFEPQINGAPGALIGTQYITAQDCVLTAGVPEVDAASVARLWPGAEDIGGTIDWDGTRRIPLSAFHDYELVVDGLVNTFHFLADNAINQGSPNWLGQDAGMMNPQGEFHSKWSATPGDRSPYRIVVANLGS